MAELDTIDIESRHLKMVKSVFARYLPYKQVWAYGSRVKWTAGHASDLDCVIFNATDSEIYNAQEAFDESDIPFEVQLLNWETIPDDFKKNIKEGYFVLRNKEDWEETTLGEIAASNLSTINKNYPHDIIQYLDTGSITCGKIEGVQEVALTDAPSRAKRLVQNGDIIYSTVRPIQRHYGFIKNPPDNLVVSTGFSVITANTDKAYPLYLYYFLTSDDTTEALDVIAEASTSAYPSLKPSDIEAQEITLPTLPEQKAIASVLSSLDDKIDLLHRQNKTLESIAETIFRQWFIEEVDDSWEEGTLGNLISVSSGKGLKRTEYNDKGIYPVLGANGNIGRTNKYLHQGRLIYTGRVGTLGNIFINDNKAWFSDNTLIIKPNYREFFYFIYFSLVCANLGNYNVGSTQPLIRQSDIKELPIFKANQNLMCKFQGQAQEFFLKIKRNQRQIKTLESLRNTLLPKLMSGDIRVEHEVAA